jgi:hypothetical protein
MAGIFRLHNKFHRSSHHTLSSTLTQDQGLDPIASQNEPFQGIFYNTLTDQQFSYTIPTNSYDWWSTYSTVNTFSANWDSIGTTYKTVNALSADWNSGYSAYESLRPVSGSFNSSYSTVYANSANWGDPNLLYTNRVQENTRSKTFQGYTLTPVGNTVEWDLNIAQVAFLTVTQSLTVLNPALNSSKRGGLYTLYVIQENGGNHDVNFGNAYKFPVGTIIHANILKPLSGVTIINFISDGNLMFGDFYSIAL